MDTSETTSTPNANPATERAMHASFYSATTSVTVTILAVERFYINEEYPGILIGILTLASLGFIAPHIFLEKQTVAFLNRGKHLRRWGLMIGPIPIIIMMIAIQPWLIVVPPTMWLIVFIARRSVR